MSALTTSETPVSGRKVLHSDKPGVLSEFPIDTALDIGEEVLERLTPRQAEVALLLAQKDTYADIAGELGITPAAVNTHVTKIYGSLGIAGKAELITLLLPEPTDKDISKIKKVKTDKLTIREDQVFDLIGRNKSYKDISSILGITENNVGTHAANAARKLGYRSRIQMLPVARVFVAKKDQASIVFQPKVAELVRRLRLSRARREAGASAADDAIRQMLYEQHYVSDAMNRNELDFLGQLMKELVSKDDMVKIMNDTQTKDIAKTIIKNEVRVLYRPQQPLA